MPIVTLLEKLYMNAPLKAAESYIQDSCEGLRVSIKVAELTSRGWIRIRVSGEDEVAALNLLEKEFGTAPVDAKSIREGNIYRGKIVSSGSSGEIHVDIGVLCPESMFATVPLQHLQSHLADGKKLPLRRVTQLFCLLENLPTEILIKNTDNEKRLFAAELGERQVLRISSWISSNLERLVVLGAFSRTVDKALNAVGHSRDVVEIERLGMLEQAVVCKLGTNAVGLIPKIGRYLPKAVFGVFSPSEISRFVKA